jgi:hypothetical protein
LALKEGFDEIKNVLFNIAATDNEKPLAKTKEKSSVKKFAKYENDFLQVLWGIVCCSVSKSLQLKDGRIADLS